MPEPITTVGAGAIIAYLSKDGMQKLLGPTADYLGGGLKDFTQRRIESIARIFERAEQKLGDQINLPGEVPPKVLKAVLDEGSFANDLLAVEYFGGILASSRTEGGRDDRGVRVAKILDSLSTYQLRTHYLIYVAISELFRNKELNFDPDGVERMQIFIPYADYFAAMDFNTGELEQISQIMSHVFHGLGNDGLIDDTWMYADKETISKHYPRAESGGIILNPSAQGAELFLWAFGHSDKYLDYIFNSNFNPSIPCDINTIKNCKATRFP